MYSPRGASSWRAIGFTLTIGLLVPILAIDWFTGAFAPKSARIVEPSPTPTAAATSTVRPPDASEFHSAWVSQRGPSAIFVNGTAELTIVYRNTGSATWVRGSASEARLGIDGDDPTLAKRGYAVDWPLPTRPAIQSEPVVSPGEVATFTFVVRGQAAGKLIIPVRVVIDGLAWLEDEGAYFEILIGAAALRPAADDG